MKMHIAEQSHTSFLINARQKRKRDAGENLRFFPVDAMQNSINVAAGRTEAFNISLCVRGGEPCKCPPPKFSKARFVVWYNNKLQSYLVAAMLAGMHGHAIGTKQCFSLQENTKERCL